MNHYWILLYLFLLLYNIHIYLESSYTYGITPDSSTPLKHEIFDLDSDDEIIVVDKNKPVRSLNPDNTSNNNPRTLVSEQALSDFRARRNVTDVIELDLTERTSTAFYDYYEQGNVESYIPKPGIAFGLIKIKTGVKKYDPYQVIWRAKDKSEFAIKAELCYIYDKAEILTIYLLNNNKKRIARYRYADWAEIDQNHRVPVVLNLSLLYHFYLDCEFHGSFRIYKVKDYCIFCGVIICSTYKYRSGTMIWETRNPYEFANKIVANGGLDVKQTNEVIVYLENGKLKHFILLEDGWTQIEPAVILDISKKESTNEYKYIKNKNNFEHFRTIGDNLFKGVKSTEGLVSKFVDDIWNAKSRMDYAKEVLIITSGKKKYLVILLIKNRYVIFFKSELVKKWTNYTDDQHTLLELKLLGFDLSELIPYSKDGKEPVKVQIEPEPTVPEQAPISETRTKNLIDLDISKMLNIKEYDIIYGQNKVIFRARGPYLFKIVKNGNEILWQPKNYNEYLYKVIYKVVDHKPKIKVYIHDDKVTPRIKHSPMTLFNPSDVRVEVNKYERGDKKVEKKQFHERNDRFSWRVI